MSASIEYNGHILTPATRHERRCQDQCQRAASGVDLVAQTLELAPHPAVDVVAVTRIQR